MSKNIFGDFAPLYWDKGLPVIPIKPGEKRPFTPAWSQYCLQMPSDAEQEYWLRNFPGFNIGLPLGPQSGLIMIDVDTEDKVLEEAILSVLPSTPWVRIGRKGYALAYKLNGQKACKIKDSEGHMIVEILAQGNQVVLPPSIHPDTGMPYTATGDLFDMLDQLPVLPQDIEAKLREALVEAGIQLSASGWTRMTDYVASGSRDIKMTAVAGVFANGITRGELSLKEAIDRMRAWHASCCEHVAGDDVDIEKGVRSLCHFLVTDVIGPKRRSLPIGWDDGLTDVEKKNLGLDFTEEQEEWDYAKARVYLTSELADPDESKRSRAIEYGLRRISRSPSMTSLEVDRLLVWITKVYPEVKLGSLRKRLKEVSVGELQGLDHTEIAEAVIADIQRFGDYKFHQSRFWKWGGSHWEPVDTAELLKIIAVDYGHLPASKKASDHSGILRVMQNMLPQGLVNESRSRYRGVNFANGFVTDELEILPHESQFGMTYTMPFRYIPGATLSSAPRFKEFLETIWGTDRDYVGKVKALRQMMAITLFGLGPSFARAVLLFGVPHSGKSQLLRIMELLMPEEAISRISPYDFGDRFQPARLSTSLLNLCGELSESRYIDGAKFKHIIDGSSMAGEFKNQQVFDFKPKATHWFSSNHLPKTKDSSDGFNRRWCVLSFDKAIPISKKIRDLGEVIVAEEREAIASWAVEEITYLKTAADINLPESHHRIVSEMSAENDTVALWLLAEGFKFGVEEDWLMDKPTLFRPSPAEKTQLASVHKIHLQDLYSDYSAFCVAQGNIKQVGKRKFSLRIREIGALKNLKMEPLGMDEIIDVEILGLQHHKFI